MMAEGSEIAKLEYFNGGVPPLALLMLSMSGIHELLTQSGHATFDNHTEELCLIGLAAYFEAYCKNQFAAVVNIMPHTLIRFAAIRECKIPVKSLLHDLENVSSKLGFVVAEEYDFGTAKYINSLFFDLLQLTPFSKTEMAEYSEFIGDRNLLVHHGGVYTLKYASQKFDLSELKTKSNWHSLSVTKEEVEKWSNFLLSIAKKLALASSNAMMQLSHESNSNLPPETVASIEALNWGFEDE